ncbi:M13-type metalloendopeptidase [Streptococcus massiliensis]|uniref:Zinc metalloproteinase in scaA 5'region n=1 Tax=Streptococcus massiliensis TaxID=313439 RepID=A0A380KZU1_9STRE|nr:M13-type metalloendopeptidase [Streptococcus massiliensis]SUN77071.1 Zinc metalloproteinase in scaA 5'region [Streptococcus massiliensis]
MTRLQDDFYEAINGEWAKTAIIPNDKPVTGGFTDIHDKIEDLMLATTDKWLAGEEVPEDAILQNFVKYHRLAADDAKRTELGTAPARSLIEEFQNLTYEDYKKRLAEYSLDGKPNALPFGVAPDFMDARINVLWAEGLSTILPDTTYYAEDHPQREQLLAIWRESETALLKAYGFEEVEITELLNKVLELDARVAKVVLSSEESSEYAKLYHPYEWEDFKALVPSLPLDDYFTAVLGQIPDKIIVPEERFWQAAEQFYSEEAWSLLKAFLILGAVNLTTSYLTDEIRVLSGAYGRALSGTPEAQSAKKAAFYLAQGPFSQAIGLWYANEKFSAAAKADVEKKVATMIDVYKERLAKKDWLTPETREKAITKLNVIKPYIGYPDKLPERYAKKIVDENLSLLENAQNLRKIEIAHYWSEWNQPVDYSEWGMPAHMVNAYYDPQKNLIVFPAAILQAPFYDLEQTASENYGGIGAVIAHEISHAFDTNGASFDENGSLNNWWTEADYEAFTEKTQKVINLFEGQDSYGAKVNGKLTVSENVADLGGVACALEAAKKEPDFSADEFFTNYARIWRMKAREEYMQLLASVDVHGPAKLRVNLQVPNFDEFFTTFGVENSDGMWREPAERIVIW